MPFGLTDKLFALMGFENINFFLRQMIGGSLLIIIGILILIFNSFY